MIQGITQSYTVFAPGKLAPLADFVGGIAHTVSDVFTMAVQISAPIIITGTLLFLGGGHYFAPDAYRPGILCHYRPPADAWVFHLL